MGSGISCRNESTSSAVGTDSCAPARVTVMAAVVPEDGSAAGGLTVQIENALGETHPCLKVRNAILVVLELNALDCGRLEG